MPHTLTALHLSHAGLVSELTRPLVPVADVLSKPLRIGARLTVL